MSDPAANTPDFSSQDIISCKMAFARCCLAHGKNFSDIQKVWASAQETLVLFQHADNKPVPVDFGKDADGNQRIMVPGTALLIWEENIKPLLAPAF